MTRYLTVATAALLLAACGSKNTDTDGPDTLTAASQLPTPAPSGSNMTGATGDTTLGATATTHMDSTAAAGAGMSTGSGSATSSAGQPSTRDSAGSKRP